MEETFDLNVHFGDRPWEIVGEIRIVDERLLAMLADRNVRFELMRDIRPDTDGGGAEVLGMSLVPVQLDPPSKVVCGDEYHHEDGHKYYCAMKPRHGGLHDSLSDSYDLYDGKSVSWLDASKRVSNDG